MRKGIRYRFNLNFRHPALKRIGTLMVPGLIGTAVYQLNVFVDTIFASFLPSGSVSYLFFADRLMEFPLGIFAIAVGMAALPSLSKLAAEGKEEELKETVRFTFRLVSFISVPAMVGLIALKTPIINLLFQRGRFDLTSTVMTARALLCYSIGLWAIAGARSVVPAFYAVKDTWTPLKMALLCLGANVVLNAILIGPLQHAGLALATSLSSILNLGLLLLNLKAKLGPMGIGKDLWTVLKNLLCSIPMGFIAYLICSFGRWSESGGEGTKVVLLLSGIGAGGLVYAWSSYQLKNEAMLFLIRMARRPK